MRTLKEVDNSYDGHDCLLDECVEYDTNNLCVTCEEGMILSRNFRVCLNPINTLAKFEHCVDLEEVDSDSIETLA